MNITNRNIAVAIILSLVTCGIYEFYWIYRLNEETNMLSNEAKKTDGVMVIILSIITCGIYMWYWLYKRGEILDNYKTSVGVAASNSSVLYLILAIFTYGIISMALIQNELNKIASGNIR